MGVEVIVRESNEDGFVLAVEKLAKCVDTVFIANDRCLICDKRLLYHRSGEEQILSCHFCGDKVEASVVCPDGHFVCFDCWKEHGRYERKEIG